MLVTIGKKLEGAAHSSQGKSLVPPSLAVRDSPESSMNHAFLIQ